MLFKSNINLYSQIENLFVTEHELVLFSAYTKTAIVKKLNSNHSLKQIVVRWEIEDLVRGSSDLALYHYCVENNIQLFRNTRIHLKACWNYDSRIIFGSANYTGRGLALVDNYNYELCGLSENLTFEDRVYLNGILQASELIDDVRFNELKTIVDSFTKPEIDYPDFQFEKAPISHFLLSQLPMSLSPDDMYDISIKTNEYGALEQSCAAHDIALYAVDPFKDYAHFKAELRYKFNSHPFIIALKNHIRSQSSQSLGYGRVVEWIQTNTTTVPTPRRWDIKREQIVNILYTWICEFDINFSWSVPGNRSEVIFYTDRNSALENFVSNLKRDKARGNLAPHQIILLIVLLEFYTRTGLKTIGFESLNKDFLYYWETYRDLFVSENPEIGMPLKVFYDRGFLKLELFENIISFRKPIELESNIKSITIDENLILLFASDNAKEYLVSKINTL